MFKREISYSCVFLVVHHQTSGIVPKLLMSVQANFNFIASVGKIAKTFYRRSGKSNTFSSPGSTESCLGRLVVCCKVFGLSSSIIVRFRKVLEQSVHQLYFYRTGKVKRQKVEKDSVFLLILFLFLGLDHVI